MSGARLVLEFINRGRLTGRAPVVCMEDREGQRIVNVLRVTRQDHAGDHAPTHYRRLTVNRERLRAPNADELADDSCMRLWSALELERAARIKRCA